MKIFYFSIHRMTVTLLKEFKKLRLIYFLLLITTTVVKAQTLPSVSIYNEEAINTINGYFPTVAINVGFVQDASLYTIEWTDDPSFGTYTFVTLGSSGSQSGIKLSFNTTYYVRVKTDLSPQYNTTSFFTYAPTVSARGVYSPIITNPNDLATGVSPTVTISCTAVPAATSSTIYTFELSTDLFTTVEQSFAGTTTRHTFSGLSYGTQYIVRVKDNISNVYQAGSFTTSTAEQFTYVTSPVNLNTGANVTLNVTSTDVNGASNYIIELNTKPDFTGTSFVKSGSSKTQNFVGLSYNTTYFTRVKTDLSLNYGKSTSFTTAPAQQFTYVSYPTNGAIGMSASLNVASTAVVGASTYTIELNTASDFSGTPFVRSGSSRVQSFSGLSYNTTYYTRVKTDLSTNYGKSTSFTTGSAAQFTYVASPANMAIGTNVTLNVTSTNVIGASTYYIELNTEPDFSGMSFLKSGSNRIQSFNGLSYNTTYYTRVKTDLSAEYGKTTSFTTAGAANYCYVISPGNNAVNVSWSPTVTVNNVGAGSYAVELSKVSDFSGEIITSETTTTQAVFQSLEFGTKYYSRVQSNLSNGVYGPTKSFTTDSPINHSYITSPVDGSTNVKYATNIVAATVKGATTYIIEVNTMGDFSGTPIIGKGRALQPFKLDYNTKYYVRVSTDLIPGVWGITKSFTTGDPVSLAYVTNPKNAATGVSITPSVYANLLSGASSYTIELNTASDFSGISIVKNGAGYAKPFTGLTNNTTYYTRVQTSLSPGNWGPTTSFTTVSSSAASRIANIPVEEEKEVETNLSNGITVSAFPNPARDYFKVFVTSDTQQDIALKIIDTNGRQLHSSVQRTNEFIEVGREFDKGLYIILINTSQGAKSLKVIKE